MLRQIKNIITIHEDTDDILIFNQRIPRRLSIISLAIALSFVGIISIAAVFLVSILAATSLTLYKTYRLIRYLFTFGYYPLRDTHPMRTKKKKA